MRHRLQRTSACTQPDHTETAQPHFKAYQYRTVREERATGSGPPCPPPKKARRPTIDRHWRRIARVFFYNQPPLSFVNTPRTFYSCCGDLPFDDPRSDRPRVIILSPPRRLSPKATTTSERPKGRDPFTNTSSTQTRNGSVVPSSSECTYPKQHVFTRTSLCCGFRT